MKLWDFLRTYISSTCSFLASLCSILSIILMLVSNETYTLIALIVLCLGFIILIYGILRGINKIVLDNSSEDYRRISSFCIFQSHDGVNQRLNLFLLDYFKLYNHQNGHYNLFCPFSFSNNHTFRAVPPAYPPNSPLLATTLWQGMMIINGLWWLALPTARAALFLPIRLANSA